MPRQFHVIGHRGAAGHAPENTFAAFDTGLAMGVDGVETDIRETGDAVLVLLHDATVDRTTDGSGAVAGLTWDELDARASEVVPRASLIECPSLERARAAGLRVWAWGVGDREMLRRAVAGGIGGCTLDYPEWADQFEE